jgi:hypothetical protein
MLTAPCCEDLVDPIAKPGTTTRYGCAECKIAAACHSSGRSWTTASAVARCRRGRGRRRSRVQVPMGMMIGERDVVTWLILRIDTTLVIAER